MSEADTRVATLQIQQGLDTDSLARMLQNQWTGLPSVEADLNAIDPGIQLAPNPPLPESQAPPPGPYQPTWFAYFDAHRDWPMAPQSYNWTCSVCSLTWLIQATGLDPNATRYDVGMAIGYPDCVNPVHGCESVECLIDVLTSYGVTARQQWVSFNEAYALTATAAIINLLGMQHFMGLRGKSGENLWVANSARAYYGVYDTLSRAQFDSLGPVQVVYLDPEPV